MIDFFSGCDNYRKENNSRVFLKDGGKIMVLIDFDEHDLAVINGCLQSLIKLCPETSEMNNAQGIVDKIQKQLNEIQNWQAIWKDMDPKDRKVVDGAIGCAFFLLQKNIDSLTVDPIVSTEIKELIKKITFRCELKMNVTPKISGLVPDIRS